MERGEIWSPWHLFSTAEVPCIFSVAHSLKGWLVNIIQPNNPHLVYIRPSSQHRDTLTNGISPARVRIGERQERWHQARTRGRDAIPISATHTPVWMREMTSICLDLHLLGNSPSLVCSEVGFTGQGHSLHVHRELI